MESLFGGTGEAGNELEINSSYSGAGTLTLAGTNADVRLIGVTGDLNLNTIYGGPDLNNVPTTTYLTALTGSILNRSVDGSANIRSGRIWLYASGSVGESGLASNSITSASGVPYTHLTRQTNIRVFN